MPRYTVQWDYSAKRDGRRFGPWASGVEVELEPADSDWIKRDSPGVLVDVAATSEPAPVADTDDQGGPPAGADGDDGNGAGSEPPVVEVEPVPDGTAQVVLEWVGSDPDRAARALDVEQAKDAPRSTLVAALERIAEPAFDRQHRGGQNRGG